MVTMLSVGCIVLIAVSISIVAFTTTKPSADEIAASKSSYQGCLSGRDLRPRGQIPVGYDSLEDYCIRTQEGDTGSGIFVGHLADIIQGAATFTILIGVVLGASLGGADWSAGTMTTLLTWEPRRIRVLLTRTVVVGVFVFAITLALQILLAIAVIGAVELRGTVVALPFTFLAAVGRSMVRVSIVSVAFGLVAMSIATLGRSTVAALGILFGYLILVEGVIAGFAHGIENRLLVRAAGVVISRQPLLGFHETITSSANGIDTGVSEPYVILGVGGAWVVVAFYVFLLLGLALVVFRARDVN
jgi:ABC-2 type transport system permease protein